MFKATFPWATKVEERAELERLRQLLANDSEEVAAGKCEVPRMSCPSHASPLPATSRLSITSSLISRTISIIIIFFFSPRSASISPPARSLTPFFHVALALAADYNISAWIRALLDPRPVRLTNGNLKDIAEPPTFIMPASKKHSSPDSVRSPSKRTVSRETRSTSPVKTDPSERPKASPKKRGRKSKKTAEDGEVNGASKSLQDIINGAPTLDATDASIDDEAAVAAVAAAVNGEAEPLPENTARVTITSDIIENEDGEEVKHTDVKIDMPLDADEQALPASPEQMTADAKKIVKDALELQKSKGGDEGKKSGSKRGRKRKASEAQADEKEVAAVAEQKKGPEEVIEELVPAESSNEPPSKRTRVMVPAEEYQREKMQRRALLGTAVAAGIGFAWTAAPYAFDFATGLLKNV
ncbi:hypothetical protein FH972_026160 [Carpinus fangiana]|uniref:Uncharacterized protein n=1 Tax=Carpinus fangiana TaxID=176857 RepID=A0A5N6L347_9ROSI|nr:hypothetical protein FH972_026160 [Carpinus fangiana]